MAGGLRGLRSIAAGVPASQEPYVEPRDTRKFDEDELRGNGLNDVKGI